MSFDTTIPSPTTVSGASAAAEQYEVLGELGEGGMGRVQRIRHFGWGLELALKTPKIAGGDGAAAAFAAEVEAWVRLGLHPHVVTCYFVRFTEGQSQLFAELVAGGTLADWIDERRLESLPDVLDIAVQVAWGLEHAHKLKLVHQDVKPANVLITPDGVAKVTDFGLARARIASLTVGAQPADGVTYRGGTPAYWSPEQAHAQYADSSQRITGKSDVYSLGVILLEMVLGERTWLYGQAARDVLNESRENIASPVQALLERLLVTDPAERPTMGEVVELLRALYAACRGHPHLRQPPQAQRFAAANANNAGVAWMELGRSNQALDSFASALRVDPVQAEARINSAIVEHRLARADLAEIDRRLTRLFDALEPAAAHRYKGDLYFELGFQQLAATSYAACGPEALDEELLWRWVVAEALGEGAASALKVLAQAPARLRQAARIDPLVEALSRGAGKGSTSDVAGVFDGTPITLLARHAQAISSLEIDETGVAWRGWDGAAGSIALEGWPPLEPRPLATPPREA
ncbi:MAG TPA: serine/threonine-protein kinase, partial [Polyangiaceae bacterium]|nr:serine/threonine-protein kinase [Polyangiaceae bacterium]